MSGAAAAGTAVPRGVGLYLAAVQFLFALGWVVYAAYLPQLAQQVGLERRWVPWILALDQLVFIVTDLVVGVWSDRAARVLSRIANAVLAATLVSTLAFALLPLAAGSDSSALFLGVTLLWAVTSSALRAPPLTLLGRYVARPAQPAMVAFTALGLGLANALSPYVGLQLKGVDPWLPFALSAVTLAVVTLGMGQAERALAAGRAVRAAGGEGAPAPAPGGGARGRAPLVFLGACALAAASFQAHVFLVSAALYQRHVDASQLPVWMPVFWVGFNLALWPASRLARRWGEPWTLAGGAVLAALAVAAAHAAPQVGWLAAAQLAAGVAWALMLCSAFGGALAFGHTGREGLFNGALQSLLAVAALARLLVVALLVPGPAQLAAWGGAPALVFGLAALLLAWGLMRTGGWPAGR